MKIVFISNYYNHHQHALSQAFDRMFPGEYHFIATSEMRDERRKLGYGQWEIPAYVRTAHTGEADAQECRELIGGADVVIAGSAPQALYRNAITAGKPVFMYRERPLKQKTVSLRQRLHFLKTRMTCGPGKKVYLLCAGGFTAGDYLSHGCFDGRTYQWGYFPEAKRHDVDALMNAKEETTIVWAGRFLHWKHPELMLQAARRLKEEGYAFRIQIIGSGDMQPEMERFLEEHRLGSHVQLLGSMKPDQVRAYMERAGIYLLTSDRQEGWGAVLNEAMNSGCAVVSGHLVGAAPFLVKDGENGLIFPSEDVTALYEKIKYLLDHPAQQKRLGRAAYETIAQAWNAETAARRFASLARQILSGDETPKLYGDGPCAGAKVIDENWYQNIHEQG